MSHKILMSPEVNGTANHFPQIEAERGKKSKSSKSARQISSTLAREPGSGFSSFNSNSSGCSSSSPSICSASQTFPMRVKGRHERDGRGGQGGGGGGGGGFITGVEGLGSLTISKKSVSMPQDMKPQPYRKGNAKALLGPVMKIFYCFHFSAFLHIQ